MSLPSHAGQLRVGRVLRAHGLKGGLKLELFTDNPAKRFVPGAEFTPQVPRMSPWYGRRLVCREYRVVNTNSVVFFEGIDDRTAAETLVRAILWVEPSSDEPTEPDSWYIGELAGLRAEVAGLGTGTVTRVETLPGHDLLAVDLNGQETLVPFVAEIVPEVDIPGRRVVITPPPGLFDTATDEEGRDAD